LVNKIMNPKYFKISFAFIMLIQVLWGQTYFTPVDPTGVPYHVIIKELTINNSEAPAGTEIGVFDGDLCVGSIQTGFSGQQNIDIVVWQGNQTYDLPGFTIGDTISFKTYSEIYNDYLELPATPAFIDGNGAFGYGSYSTVNLNVLSGITPHISIQETQLNFGNVLVGEIQSKFLVIENTGTANLSISQIQTENNQFRTTYDSYLIPAGNKDSIKVTFNPTSPVFVQSQLIIHSDDPESPVVKIALYGQGLPHKEPTIVTSTNTLDFGSVRIGDTNRKTFQIFNYGQDTLLITDMTVSQNAFKINMTQSTIVSGASISLEVSFSPQYDGNINAVLAIYSNAQNANTYNISLTGKGFSGHFQSVNPTGLPYIIIIQNVTIDQHSLNPGDEVAVFDGDLCVGNSIFYGSFPIQLTTWQSDPANNLSGFTPGNPIQFNSWATTYDQTVELILTSEWVEGTGTFGDGEYSVVNLSAESGMEPRIFLSDQDLYFGESETGIQQSQSLVIHNNGLSRLTINNISLTNSAFNTDQKNFSIDPDDSVTITIHFTPYQPVFYNAVLTIFSNDPATQNISINLSGQGLPSVTRYLYAPTAPLRFNPTIIHYSSKIQIHLFNAGSGIVSISSISITSSNFHVENTQFDIEPGKSYPLTVFFSPDDIGYFPADITIYNSSQNQSVIAIPLHGVGYENYFTPVQPTGIPYTIVIDTITTKSELSIESGDEIGIFDGRLCVGTVIVDTSVSAQSGTTWKEDEENNLPGFHPGNPIKLQYAKQIGDIVLPFEVEISFIEGDGTFNALPYTSVQLALTETLVIPSAPSEVTIIDSLQAVHIQWAANQEPDLSYYKIYRGEYSDFPIVSSTLIDSVFLPQNIYIDSTVENQNRYYYKITAVDSEGWESESSDELVITATVVNIWDITFQQRVDGSGLVNIYYSFSGHDTTHYEVIPYLSNFNDEAWGKLTQVSGDAGAVLPGDSRQITWNLKSEAPEIYSNNSTIKITIGLLSKGSQYNPLNEAKIQIEGRIER